jgi:DNA replication and repair protein RecF
MYVRKLELTNFRNYDKYKLDNLSNLNIIIGENGIGKTSIIESIYVCSLARSFKSNDDDVIIKDDAVFSKVKVELDVQEKIKKLEYTLTNKGKKTKINGSLKKRISDFISQYKVILFSPDELRIIKDAPNTRRNYLNIGLSQINKSYIGLLNNYNIVVKNKNDFLKKIFVNSNMDKSYLDILDLKISEFGFEICNLRKEYIDKLNRYIKKIFHKFRKNDELYIRYNSQFLGKSVSQILEILKRNRDYELNLGLTKTGIHRDDIEFIYNGKNAKEFSSQGIQKLILLSLKLAELEVLINDYYEEPILLLDDLFSELDSVNQNSILNNLNKDIQVFITTTDINNIKPSMVKRAKVIDLNGRMS